MLYATPHPDDHRLPHMLKLELARRFDRYVTIIWELNCNYRGQMVPPRSVVGLTYAINVCDTELYMTVAHDATCVHVA